MLIGVCTVQHLAAAVSPPRSPPTSTVWHRVCASHRPSIQLVHTAVPVDVLAVSLPLLLFTVSCVWYFTISYTNLRDISDKSGEIQSGISARFGGAAEAHWCRTSHCGHWHCSLLCADRAAISAFTAWPTKHSALYGVTLPSWRARAASATARHGKRSRALMNLPSRREPPQALQCAS